MDTRFLMQFSMLAVCFALLIGLSTCTARDDSMDHTSGNTTLDVITRRATFDVKDIRDVSLLQIRNALKTEVELRVYDGPGITVIMDIEGSDRAAIHEIAAVADVRSVDRKQIVILQIDRLNETPLWIYITSSVLPLIVILITTIIGVVCWRKNRHKKPGPRKKMISSQINRHQQAFKQNIEMTELSRDEQQHHSPAKPTDREDKKSNKIAIKTNKECKVKDDAVKTAAAEKPRTRVVSKIKRLHEAFVQSEPETPEYLKATSDVSNDHKKTVSNVVPAHSTSGGKSDLPSNENVKYISKPADEKEDEATPEITVDKGKCRNMMAMFEDKSKKTSEERPNNYPPSSTGNRGGRGKGGRGGGGGRGTNLQLSAITVLALCTVLHAVSTIPFTVNKITIYINPTIFSPDEGHIEILVPELHFIGANTTKWTEAISVLIYDLPKLPGLKEFCFARHVCHGVRQTDRSRVTCDGSTETCVCSKGYTLESGACIDIDECNTSRHNCDMRAACMNTVGGFTCACREDLSVWGNGIICYDCSTECPYEHYQSHPCSSTDDQVCTACRQCSEEEYEAFGCGERINRHCLYPAGSPAVLNKDSARDQYKPVENTTGYIIRHDNKFMIGENLHNVSDLSWNYKVDHEDAGKNVHRSKILKRESGIEVHLTIPNEINLTPLFREPKTTYADSAFIISGLNESQQEIVNEFTKTYCRRVVPDYYILNMTLHTKRETKVLSIGCADGRCPPGFESNDTISYRSLNERCPGKTKSPVQTINKTAETAICLNNIPLIVDTFEAYLNESDTMDFPNETCRQAVANCTDCLHGDPESSCLPEYQSIRNGTEKERCCKLSCYELLACKTAFNPKCNKVPSNCSEGDVAEFKLTSHLDSTDQLSCYLEAVQMKTLYTYTYELVWRKLNSKVGRKTVTVSSESRESEDDFVLVKHKIISEHTGNSIILRGTVNGTMTIHPVKQEADFINNKLQLKSNSIEMQTSRPFLINKLIGEVPMLDNSCPTDLGIIYEKQPLYTMDDPVEVIANKMNEKFYLASVSGHPEINIMVPGNRSLMSRMSFGKSIGANLINDDSLKADLDRDNIEHALIIKIKGYLYNCPGSLSFTVNDANELLELIRYDAVVLCAGSDCKKKCPFEIEFHLPLAVYGEERLFIVNIRDFNSTYELLLASVKRFQLNLPNIHIPDYLFTIPEFPWRLFGSIIALVSCALLSLLAIIIFAEITNPHRHMKKLKKKLAKKSGWVTGKDAELADKVYVHSNKLQARHLIFILWTIAFKVAYACIFTFSAFYYILVIVHYDDLETLRTLPQFIRLLNERNENISRAIDQHRENEILRQQDHTDHTQQSCDVYINNLFNKLRRKMAEITLTHRLAMLKVTISYQIGLLTNKRLGEFQKILEDYIEQYKRKVKREFQKVFDPFSKWLKRVTDNKWFKIGKAFHKIREFVRTDISLSLPAINLMDYLGIDAALDINYSPHDFLIKIRESLPGAPDFVIPDFGKKFPNFTFPGFLPEDFLNAPDFNILFPNLNFSGYNFLNDLVPDIPLDICPGLNDIDLKEKSSSVDSQRAFSSGVAGNVDEDANEILDEYFSEVYQKQNTTTDPRSILRSMDDTKELNIEQADAEQEFYDYQQEVMAETDSVNKSQVSQVWQYTKTSLFKTFLVLDGILVTYRFVKIFIVIAQLIRGFPEIIPQSVTEKKIAENKKIAEEFEAKLHESALRTKQKAKKNTGDKIEEMETSIKSAKNDDDTKNPKERWLCLGYGCFYVLSMIYLVFIRGVKTILLKVFRSPLIPKIILVGIVGLVSYFVIVAGFLYMTVQALDQLGFYDLLAAKLDLNMEFSNLKILENLNFLQNTSLQHYYYQMEQELNGMANVIDAFNEEQAAIFNFFENQICGYRMEIRDDRMCDFKFNIIALNMDLLPCTLRSTEPNVYRGYDREAFRNQTKFDSQPYVDATRNIILKSFYAILIALGSTFIIAAFSYLIFFYLKSRNMIRIVKIYEMDKAPLSFEDVLEKQRQKRQVREERQKAQSKAKDNPPGDNPPGDNPPGDNPPGDNPPDDNPLTVSKSSVG